MAVKGVIFDVDGTLVDSNDEHTRAWVDALDEFGYEVPYESVRPLIGMGGDKVLPILTGVSVDDLKGERISELREEIFAERYLPKVRPFPGARELLVRLRQEGLRLAVASSSKEEMLKRLLSLIGAEDLLDAKASSDDAQSSKPDPDIVKAALRRLGLPAESALMVGDTPYDIEAATRAGLKTIAFRCGGWKDADLAGAREVHDGPADLLAHLDRSILSAAMVS